MSDCTTIFEVSEEDGCGDLFHCDIQEVSTLVEFQGNL